ncbi:hypothetical protein [Pseudomonas aeruginosa]|uniref:hypothetical protein n=1 Tax=Pseudomonas aeruginosa TaxID=287 RepID=UPI0003BAD0D0|nr:hypothetical protein [Pseudomonas aeruginosa]ERZ01102.1 hypothetical protein Q022_02244 [Pseudomonas aeruginosa BWHPSA009]
MTPDDVRELLSPAVGIFLGGSTAWKLQTMESWGVLARRRNCYFHVGRVNSARLIAMCSAAGASSFEGTSVMRFTNTLPRLDAALSFAGEQKNLFDLNCQHLQETPYDCRQLAMHAGVATCVRHAAADGDV